MTSESKPALLIMAAGMGSRYGGLKQIDPIGPSGEIILDYSVFDAIEAGFDKVVFVIRHDIEDAFKEAVGSHFEGRVAVEYAFQTLDGLPTPFALPEGRSKPWGTGQAILVAKDLIDQPFAVINADDYYGKDTFKVLADRLKQTDPASNDYSMAAFSMNNTLSDHGGVTRGVCESNARQQLVEVRECEKLQHVGSCVTGHDIELVLDKEFTGNELVSMNCWGFTPTLFTYLQAGFEEWLAENGSGMKTEFLIPSVVDGLIKSGTVTVDVLETPEKWYGITYPQDKPAIVKSMQALVDSGRYATPLWT